jgi:thymidylate synthase
MQALHPTVNNIREHFITELKAQNFTVDRSGQKMIELIGACFQADEPSIFGEVNDDYVKSEVKWYECQSTNINDIYDGHKEPPVAWKMTANKHGEINSNYGHLIFSDKYYRQYDMVLDELLNNMDTRRATMVYNRPSIWMEFNENGKNDFICTNAVTYYIRGGAIHAVVQMRSNDVVFGYKNDYAWQRYLLERLTDDYNTLYLTNAADADYRREMEAGSIIWQVQNLHVYERHFHLVK